VSELSRPARAALGAPIALAAIIFVTLSLAAAVTSQGFLEADSCTHYQYARFALGEPHYLVNVWGRPFVTGLYTIPATLAGRMGVRVTSLVCALLIATIAWRIARDLNYRWPALAFVFTLAQPLVFLHSFSELTELPFALLIGLAFWCYLRKHWLVMTIIISLAPTARPEGFGFVLLAAAALLLHRKWWWIALLPLPLLIWTYAGWRLYGRPIYVDDLAQRLPANLHWLLWLRHEWPYAQKSTYASGNLFHFVALLPAAVGPIVFPFIGIGAVRSFSRDVRRDHAARAQLLIAAIPVTIVVIHSLLFFLGRMASSGEVRYMLIGAPFWALLAAKGWEWVFTRLNWRHPYLLAGIAALLPIVANYRYQVVPFNLTDDGRNARAVAEWFLQTEVSREYPRVLASNPEVAYFMGVSHTDASRIVQWRKDVIAKAPPGTLLVWDSTYAPHNADAARVVTVDEILAAGWVERPEWATPLNEASYFTEWRIFVSPKSIFGR
jgi:hypothetical protein